MACQPSHFFKSVPAILAKKKTFYCSPVAFVGTMAALQSLIFATLSLGVGIPTEVVIAANFSAALITPVAAPAFCAVLFLSWAVARVACARSDLGDGTDFNHHGVLLTFDPRTYASLNWGRFMWSMLYYYVYFYALAFAALAILLLGLVVAQQIFSKAPYLLSGRGGLLLLGVFTLSFAIAGYKPVARPYIYALRWSARRRTPLLTEFLRVEKEVAHLRELERRLRGAAERPGT